MKVLKRIHLKIIMDVLSDQEKRKIVGGDGYDGGYSIGKDKCNVGCKSDSDCDSVCSHCVYVGPWGGTGYFCMSQK